jgi:hypothetical protein
VQSSDGRVWEVVHSRIGATDESAAANESTTKQSSHRRWKSLRLPLTALVALILTCVVMAALPTPKAALRNHVDALKSPVTATRLPLASQSNRELGAVCERVVVLGGVRAVILRNANGSESVSLARFDNGVQKEKWVPACASTH